MIMIIGIIKSIMKNRLSVGLHMANPPHSHSTIVIPIYGIAEKILVITVAAQKLICPHGTGSTYPITALIMVKINILTPVFHTFYVE